MDTYIGQVNLNALIIVALSDSRNRKIYESDRLIRLHRKIPSRNLHAYISHCNHSKLTYFQS